MYSDDELSNFESKNKDTTKKVNMKTKPSKSTLQEPDEDFYNDFYEYERGMEEPDIEEEPELELEEQKSSRGKLGIVVILLLVLGVLGFLVYKSYTNKQENKDPEAIVNIQDGVLEVNENEDKKISYSFENFQDDPKASFVSGDTNIATVNEEGVVHGVTPGETKIIMSYFLKEVPYQKEVTVKVIHVDNPEPEPTPPEPTPEPTPQPQPTPKPSGDTTKPTLNLSGGSDSWVNHNVTITVSASDNSGKVTTKYALNCTSNCKYQNVSGGKITVSASGQTVVNVQAVDPSGNSVNKTTTVKIDKTAPKCSLKVSSDGTLSASISDNSNLLSYYGFNNDYKTSRTKSKKITSAGAYTYYVQDQAGNRNSCSLTVNAKTQYRSRTCDNSHKTFGSWYVRKQVYITSCGAYAKGDAERAGSNWYRTRSEVAASNCNGNSPCYYCTAYARSITGCNWGDEAWSGYQDAPIESSASVQVQQAQIFY